MSAGVMNAMQRVEMDVSDLFKIYDALAVNHRHHLARDQMNAATHQADNVRLSPITTTTGIEAERLARILAENGHTVSS